MAGAAGGRTGAGQRYCGHHGLDQKTGEGCVLGRHRGSVLQRRRTVRRRAMGRGGEHAENRDSRRDLERRYAIGHWQPAGDVVGGRLGNVVVAQQTGAAWGPGTPGRSIGRRRPERAPERVET
ncbi:hypothetical protein D3C78_1463590 [compost metagenome]